MSLWVLNLGLVLVISLFLAGAVGFPSPKPAVCPAASAVDSIILRSRGVCSGEDFTPDPVGVMEGDEVWLQRALSLVHKNREEYVSLLFYATWCPFSKTLRSNFTILASLFPTIRHIAVEESSIRPRILARYGVHGFPTLFLLNSMTRVRYHGSRTLDSLFAFYNDVTGIKPESLDRVVFERIWDQLNLSTIADPEQECPFSWARSPEKLLREETYLALAITFVLLRFLHILLPTFKLCIERIWRWRLHNMSMMRLWEHPQSCLEQAMQAFSRLKPCKRTNLQEGAMNAKAWASKSLATVNIGDAPSSSRVCLGSER